MNPDVIKNRLSKPVLDHREQPIENQNDLNRPGPVNKGESQKFGRDIMWFAVSQLFVSLILGLITLPTLTKSYGPIIYGIWVQINVTVDFVSPLLSMQLGIAAVRFLAGEENIEKRRRALGAMLYAITAIVLVASAIGIGFSRQLSFFLFNSPSYVTYIQFLIVWVAFNSIFNFLLSYMRARLRIKEISIIQIAFTAMKVAAILILAIRAAPVGWILAAMVALQVTFTIWTLIIIVREVGFPLADLSRLPGFLSYCLPQTPVVILLWAITLSDRYFITKFLGLSYTAIYSSSAMLAAMIALFYFPISFVLFPQLARLWEQNLIADVRKYFEWSMKLFLTLAIPGAIGITIVSQPLLNILATAEFLAGREIVFILALGAVFLGVYQININLILIGHKAKWLPVITSSAYITSVVMSLILVPRIGIMGAAISNCASFFVVAITTAIWAKRIIAYSFDFAYLSKVIVSSGAMFVMVLFVKVESIMGMVFAGIVGLTIFGTGLAVSRAFSVRDMKNAWRTFIGASKADTGPLSRAGENDSEA